ncbi:hypothetical protein ACS0TY_013219 [Phlomoides rotata]
MRDFLWRACRDFLSHMVNLFEKHVVGDKACVLCDGFQENYWHLFVSCVFAWDCWIEAGLSDILEEAIVQADNFVELVFIILNNLDNSVVECFVSTLWVIWKERNSKLWEGRRKLSAATVF